MQTLALIATGIVALTHIHTLTTEKPKESRSMAILATALLALISAYIISHP